MKNTMACHLPIKTLHVESPRYITWRSLSPFFFIHSLNFPRRFSDLPPTVPVRRKTDQPNKKPNRKISVLRWRLTAASAASLCLPSASPESGRRTSTKAFFRKPCKIPLPRNASPIYAISLIFNARIQNRCEF